ncbi:MAG: histidinol dehydrogenase, partial [Lachnospiraceae bacterium]|nr:histidinol dehydrogenase [Lachnospiraceae bacterium]
MRTIQLDEVSKKNVLEDLLKRSPNQYGEYEGRVAEILAEVKEKKDEAVFAFTKKFDGADVNASNIQVTDAEIEEAYSLVDASLLAVIRKALVNIESYHAKQ